MNKCKITTVLLMLLFQSSISFGQNYNLVWQDEFTGSIGPDWVFETGRGNNGWGNEEFQYYRRENARVENGNLVITAKRENFNGANYTSSRMKTQGRKRFRYGKIEARIALPSGQGLWPAFWMLGSNIGQVGWPACGEIDIMERVNNSPDIFGTIHWSDNNNNYATYGTETPISNPGQFHTYAIEWDKDKIVWFLDGREYHEVNISNGINGTSEFGNEFFILLNVAVGGRFPGFVVDNNRLPAEMLVDYVRVYEQGGTTTPPPTPPTPPTTGFNKQIEAENYIDSNDVQTEPSSEGGENVGYINDGSWMAYEDVTFPTSGEYRIEYRVASAINGGRFSADLSAGSIKFNELSVPNTGGWQNWRTISQNVNINAGTYQFGIFSVTGGWNINWIRIIKIESGNKNSSESLNIESLGIYPNPFSDVLNLEVEEGSTMVQILDMQGRKVQEQSITERSVTINTETLPKGIYMLQVSNGVTSNTRKIIKQ